MLAGWEGNVAGGEGTMLSGRAGGSSGGRRQELEHPVWDDEVPGLSLT